MDGGLLLGLVDLFGSGVGWEVGDPGCVPSGYVVALVDGGDLFVVPLVVVEEAVWFDVGHDLVVVLEAPLFGAVDAVAVGEVVAVGLFGEVEAAFVVLVV